MPAPAITSPMPIPKAMSVPVDGVPEPGPRAPAAVFDSVLDVIEAEPGRAAVLDDCDSPLELVPDCEALGALDVVMAPLCALLNVSDVVCVLEHVVRLGRFGRGAVVTMAGTVTSQVLPTGSGTRVWSPASLKGAETVAGALSVASPISAEPSAMSPIATTRLDRIALNPPRLRVARRCGGSST